MVVKALITNDLATILLVPVVKQVIYALWVLAKKNIIVIFRIIDLGGNSFQIFESKGAICKIFRNQDLAAPRPPKILWGSLDVRRDSTDTLEAAPINFYYCNGADGKSTTIAGNGLPRQTHFPIWEWGSGARAIAGIGTLAIDCGGCSGINWLKPKRGSSASRQIELRDIFGVGGFYELSIE